MERFFLHVSCTLVSILAGYAFISTCIQLQALHSFVHHRLATYAPGNPSEIYGGPTSISKGMRVSSAWFTEKLEKADYVQSSGTIVRSAEYKVAKGKVEFVKRTGDNSRILVSFGEKGGIYKILNLTTNKEIQSYALDPELLARLYGNSLQARSKTVLKEIPQTFIQAVIAVEDRRFFQHPGVDLRSIARAIVNNMKPGNRIQGGSTITQQLVKNLFLSPEKSLKRKATEAVLALMAEVELSKDQILELYLNEVYLGQDDSVGIYGAQEASRLYFGKDLKSITLSEAALLAGMIQAPRKYNPFAHPMEALKRRNTVLSIMTEMDFITSNQRDQTVASPLDLRPYTTETNRGPYFVEFVREQLFERYGQRRIQQGNLSVQTTLNISMQNDAEEAMTSGLLRIDKTQYARTQKLVQGCLIAVDPATGAIKAMVGGRDYFSSQYNRAVQANRQPGSAFKPIVYAAAMESGITPSTLLSDDPLEVPDPDKPETPWEPKNYDKKYHGIVSVRHALASSMNIATVRLAQETGISHIVSLAKSFGFENVRPYPSLPLGTLQVTPADLIEAYTAFANGGTKVDLAAVEWIKESNQKIVFERKLSRVEIMTPQTAFIVTDMLRTAVESGTGASIRRLGFNRPVAGKTGTTDDFRDAWFIGYTPGLICLVWVGYDDNTPLNINAAEAAIPIWVDFMKKAVLGIPPKEFQMPNGIVFRTIDPYTGKLAVDGCPEAVDEVFIQGTEPLEPCNSDYDLMPQFVFTQPAFKSKMPTLFEETLEAEPTLVDAETDNSVDEHVYITPSPPPD